MNKKEITFTELMDKDKAVTWAINKIKDDKYTADISINFKNRIQARHIPGIFIPEDGKNIYSEDKNKELAEKEKAQLAETRLKMLLTQIQQCVNSAELYGLKINGSITSSNSDEKES